MSGSTVAGDQAVGLATSATQEASIVRSRITGVHTGVFVDGATKALVADDLIDLTGSPGQAFILASGSQQTVTMDSDTLVGAGGIATGVQDGTSLPAAAVTLNVDDTTIRGFATDLAATGSPAHPATLTIRYSDFDPAKEVIASVGATFTQGPDNLHNADPHFVNWQRRISSSLRDRRSSTSATPRRPAQAARIRSRRSRAQGRRRPQRRSDNRYGGPTSFSRSTMRRWPRSRRRRRR